MARGIGKLFRQLKKAPFVSKALKLIPGVGTAYAAYDIASGLLPGRGGGGALMPPLPGDGKGGMLPFDPNMGKRSIFRDDPNVVEALKAWAIPARSLKQFHRAPRGFVVKYDSAGDPYGIPKKLAKLYLGHKDPGKPPISVRDWNSLKRADSVIKKFKVIEQRAMRIGNFGRRNKSPWEAAAMAAGKKAMGKALGKVAA